MIVAGVRRGGGTTVGAVREAFILVNRFKKLKRAEQLARSQEGSSASNFSPVTTTSPVEDVNKTTITSYADTPLDSSSHEGVVPCSKWICIKPFMELSGVKSDICVAQLIYHPIMYCNFASPQCGNDIPKEEDKPVTKE